MFPSRPRRIARSDLSGSSLAPRGEMVGIWHSLTGSHAVQVQGWVVRRNGWIMDGWIDRGQVTSRAQLWPLSAAIHLLASMIPIPRAVAR